MHHRIIVALTAEVDDLFTVGKVAVDKFGTGVNSGTVSGDQSIKNGDFVPLFKKILSTDTADVSGTAGNQNFSHFPLLSDYF